MENDDILLKRFFTEHKQQPADDGFSRRVMRSLPDRVNPWLKVWNFCCWASALLIFVALDGFSLVWNALREVFISLVQQGAAEQIDLKSLFVVAAVLSFLGYRKLASMA